jgi:hypothetical protein
MQMTVVRALAGVIGWFALAGSGCGSVAATKPDAASTSDGPTADAGPDASPDATLSWSALSPVTVGHAGPVIAPVVSEDGLTLYFLAELTSPAFDYDIYSASRASLDEPFGVATQLINVNLDGHQARYPDVSSDGLELYFSDGDTGTLMVASRSNTSSAFSMPEVVRRGVAGNFASISGNKLALYYITHTGNADGMVMRMSRAAVGQPWSAPSPVTLDGAVQIYSSIDISADELSLLRAPTASSQNRNVLISRRSDKTAAFTTTEVLPVTGISAVRFASTHWSNHESAIWASTGVNSNVETLQVSLLR